MNQSYGYDTLDRLTQFSAGYPGATTPATGQGFLPAEAFTYDAIGNRLTRTATPPGGSASTATYAYPNTSATPAPNRNHTLASIAGAQTNAYTYDATGNTNTESAALGTSPNPTNGTQLTQTYDAKNRLKITQIGTTATDTVTYKINALGQRVQKTGAGTYVYSTSTTIDATTGLSPQAASIPFNARYVYDEQGRLLGEYSPEGKLIAETIWFDDLPVATLRPKGSSVQLPLGIAGTGTATANNAGNNTPANPVNVDVFYLHPDHLGTPRAMTRSTAVAGATTGPNAINKATWRWESDPFGTSLNASAPNGNPQNVTGTASQITAASFRVNNRFPGQLFDAESAKSFNYFRDYDSSIGRYVESDPIGLRGGVNTFGYVLQHPMNMTDPKGLITAAEGYAHYCNGNGATLTLSMAEVGVNVSAGSFSAVRGAGRPCVDATYNIRDSRQYTTHGDIWWVLGDVTLKLQGMLNTRCDCSFTFSGNMTIADDFYNFNPSTHRSFLGESATTLGRWGGKVCGSTPYAIKFTGSQPINQSGKLLGTSTCCR